jgi:hypothetical protein
LLAYMLAKVSAVAGDPAVAVTLLRCGIKKIKHFRLSDYDYRTGNFFNFRIIDYQTIHLGKILDYRQGIQLSNYRLPEPAFKV